MIDKYLTLLRNVLSVDIGCLVACLLIASAILRRLKLRHAVLLICFVIADAMIALAPIAFDLNPGKWNWIGQGASAAFSLAILITLLHGDDSGLRLPSTRPQWLWTIAGILCCIVIAAWPAISGPGERPTLETLFYQATLPGITEELAVRGVTLALLIRAFDDGTRSTAAVVLAAVTTVIWFAAGHVFHVEDGQMIVVWRRALDVIPMATVYVVTRLKSRSLLGSMIGHNAANTLVEGIALFRFP